MSKLPPKLQNLGERTRLVHAGRDPNEQHGFVNTPIYRGSTVLFPTTDDLLKRQGALHLRDARNADHRGSGDGLDTDCGRRRHGSGALRVSLR